MDEREAEIARIDAQLQDLDAEIMRIKAIARAQAARRDEVAALIAAERRVAAMSDSEKDALRQLLAVDGIPSGERVGEPGGRS